MRILRRIPTEKQQRDALWRTYDPDTRAVVCQLARLGYHMTDVQVTDPADEDRDSAVRIHLDGVGAHSLTLVLRFNLEAAITAVICGTRTRTARQAVAWLRTQPEA